MKIPALLSIGLLVLAPAAGCASNRDFDNVVSAIERHYAVHAQQVPMMGFASFCARVASHDGVKDMRIAEFDHLTVSKSDDLSRLVRDGLGQQWQPFVVERDATGEQDVIFVRPHGTSMRMLIVDYENGELDLVRLDLNGERLRQWMHDPAQTARQRNHGTQKTILRSAPTRPASGP